MHDVLALAKAGQAPLSDALTVIETLKNEEEYLVWEGVGESIGSLVSIWWEHPEVVDKLNAFRRVSRNCYR